MDILSYIDNDEIGRLIAQLPPSCIAPDNSLPDDKPRLAVVQLSTEERRMLALQLVRKRIPVAILHLGTRLPGGTFRKRQTQPRASCPAEIMALYSRRRHRQGNMRLRLPWQAAGVPHDSPLQKRTGDGAHPRRGFLAWRTARFP